MDKAEQEAEEILVEQGFADPEDLEPEMTELMRLYCKLLLEWLEGKEE